MLSYEPSDHTSLLHFSVISLYNSGVEADLDLGQEEQEIRSHSFAELSQAESKASMRQTKGTRVNAELLNRLVSFTKESPEIDSEDITVTSHNPIASLIIASNDSVDDR